MAFVLENRRVGQIEHATQRVSNAIRHAHVVRRAVPQRDDVFLNQGKWSIWDHGMLPYPMSSIVEAKEEEYRFPIDSVQLVPIRDTSPLPRGLHPQREVTLIR